jgi:hypothetical protein
MSILAMALAGGAVLAAQGVNPRHFTEREASIDAPSSASQMARRLDGLADKLHEMKVTGPRVALYDLAWPADATEFDAVGRNAILQVTVVVADPSELPLQKVYVRNSNGDTPLLLLARKDSRIEEGKLLTQVVGGYREDCYYLLPAIFALGTGKILVDYAQHRMAFVLDDKLPVKRMKYRISPRSAQPVNKAAMSAFLKREFLEAPSLDGSL